MNALRATDPVVLPGGFELLANLGAGGMGSVYLARYLGSCLVAVKVVDAPRGQTSEEQRRRFERECRILTELRHPAIVTAYSYGAFTDQGARHLVMEFVDGVSLRDLRAIRGAPLGSAEAVEILLPIADALAYCHSRRVYHRDVSPSNLLTSSSGTFTSCKLVDFGASWQSDLGRVTRGVVFTSTDFQPLERFNAVNREKDPDAAGVAADMYALAAVAYFLTAGDGSDGAILSVKQKIGTAEITVAGEPAWSAFLGRALRPSAIDRFQSMAELRDRMRVFAPRSGALGPESFWPRVPRPEGSLPPGPIPPTLINRPATTTDPIPASPSPAASPAAAGTDTLAAFVAGLIAGALAIVAATVAWWR